MAVGRRSSARWSCATGRVFFLSLVLGSGGNALGTLDALFVFRRDKRCLHDLIAGTKVVRAVAPKP
jgi:uncharacterized RDD family membrane protein YckC